MKIQAYKIGKDTRYKIVGIYLGVDAKTGKPKRTNRQGFKTKREAEIAYSRILKQEEEEKSGAITFGKVYEKWLESYEKTVTPASFLKVKEYFNNHILPFFSDFLITKIDLHDCQKAINEWSEKTSEFRRIKNYTSKVFNYAQRSGYIDKNPFSLVIIPRIKKEKEYIFFEKDEMLEFLEIVKSNLSYKWYVFFRLLCYTGIRRGEILALEWSDIDFKNRTLNINKALSVDKNGKKAIKTTKTKAGVRNIHLDDETLEILAEFKKLEHINDIVFPNAKNTYMTSTAPLKPLVSITKKFNLKSVTLHGLRHTHCSLLFASGCDIKQIQHRMGHKDLQTTLNIYTHLTKDKKDETIENFIKYIS